MPVPLILIIRHTMKQGHTYASILNGTYSNLHIYTRSLIEAKKIRKLQIIQFLYAVRQPFCWDVCAKGGVAKYYALFGHIKLYGWNIPTSKLLLPTLFYFVITPGVRRAAKHPSIRITFIGQRDSRKGTKRQHNVLSVEAVATSEQTHLCLIRRSSLWVRLKDPTIDRSIITVVYQRDLPRTERVEFTTPDLRRGVSTIEKLTQGKGSRVRVRLWSALLHYSRHAVSPREKTIGSAGWFCFFAKQASAAAPKKSCCSSEDSIARVRAFDIFPHLFEERR